MKPRLITAACVACNAALYVAIIALFALILNGFLN
jgi:hypothetical protein